MGVIYCREIAEGRRSSSETSKKGTIRRHTRVFRVRCSSPYDDGTVAGSALLLPAIGAPHPNDVYAWVRSITPEQSKGKLIWLVRVEYSSEYEPAENPLAEPARITWDTQEYQRPFFQDKDGKAICNAAGDFFDPSVEDDDSWWIATVTKNVPAVPTWVVTSSYRNAVNSDTFSLDGLSIGPRKAKMKGIRISEWQTRDNCRYRVLEFQIALNEDTWDKKVYNAGLREIDEVALDRVPIYNKDGTRVTAPVALDADGYAIHDPTLDTIVFNTYRVKKELPFGSLPLT